MAQNEDLLKEIRENCDYAKNYWSDIRSEGQIDMKFLSGDPWPAEERKAREDAKRPIISPDELNQYCNQLINDVRQNKRAIRVIPKGSGANDKTAELRGNLIRAIEYKSRAQQAYCTAFEGAVQRGYGFAKIGKRFCSADSFDQELVIRRIPNPDTVYIDPDCLEQDCSDMGWAFILESFRHSQFKKQFPKAEMTSFSREQIEASGGWLTEDKIQVAEYWRRESKSRTLLLLEGPNGESGTAWEDELPHDGKQLALPEGLRVVRDRRADDVSIVQRITNGVEILETSKWDGKYIPIGVCFGKEMYIDKGAGAKRLLMSLIRLAREPFLAYCYFRTCEMELAGMTPKVPWMAVEGQLEGHEDQWDNAHKVPVGHLYYKRMVDAAPGVLLDSPQRIPYEPPIQAMELGAESFRRAIQSAMGMYNTSVGKSDTAARSGVALEKLDQQSSQGSFHFIDSYDTFLEHMGRMMEDLLDKTYDTPREVLGMGQDEKHSVIRLNQEYVDSETGQKTAYRVDEGDHDVTISTGPSSESQREAAETFAGSLAQNEVIFPRIADLVVKLRNLGPIGDEIAKRLIPPDIAAQENGQQQIPPQAQQALQQQGAVIEELTKHVEQLSEDIKTKRVEMESRERIEMAKIQSAEKIADNQEQTKLTIGLAQLDQMQALKAFEQELASIKHRLDMAHEGSMQAADQEHEANENALDRMHQAGMTGMQQTHEAVQNYADREQQSNQFASQQQAETEGQGNAGE